MANKEVIRLREANIILLVALEKLALHKDASVSSIATEALNKVRNTLT